MKIKECLDSLFSKYNFDTSLYKKIVKNNVEFITSSNDHKHLFGSRLIGCFYIKYTMYEKNIFYNNLFDLEADDVITEIEKISTIPKNFKIARDDINLVCMYIAHRFLTNEFLSKEKRLEYAAEILNYFTYRTLVLISSIYFVYPISEEKAVSLSERLNSKYIIKKVKNWNEFSMYRSDEYLKSKYLETIMNFNKDNELPNAISDLYNRTKETLKNIYSEFIDMLEKDDIIKSKSSIINDIEGQEVIIDKLNTPDSYYTKIEQSVVDKNTFIKNANIDVTISIINTISHKQLKELLTDLIDYSYADKKNYDKVHKYIKGVIINSIEYLHKNEIYITNKTNVLIAINSIVGNVLFARGGDISINKIKDEGDKLIKDINKYNKKYVNTRSISNLRNALYVYIILFILTN